MNPLLISHNSPILWSHPSFKMEKAGKVSPPNPFCRIDGTALLEFISAQL